MLRVTKRSRLASEDDESGMDEIPLMYGEMDNFEMDEGDSLMKPRRYRNPRQSSIAYFLSDGWWNMCVSCWERLCRRKKEYKPRIVPIGIGRSVEEKFAKNVIRNQKYSIISFIPKVLFEQFKFFLNLYFLIMATSQFIPEIRIGYLYTYWGTFGKYIPIKGFVLCVTMCREALDDYRRYRRDKEANSQKYKKLTRDGIVTIPSSAIRVGDLVMVEKVSSMRTVSGEDVVFTTTRSDGVIHQYNKELH
ncbi:hypothetical protein ScPMuIL_000537 [Solemya velum]